MRSFILLEKREESADHPSQDSQKDGVGFKFNIGHGDDEEDRDEEGRHRSQGIS